MHICLRDMFGFYKFKKMIVPKTFYYLSEVYLNLSESASAISQNANNERWLEFQKMYAQKVLDLQSISIVEILFRLPQ